MNGLSLFEETQTKFINKGYKMHIYKLVGSDIIALHINVGGKNIQPYKCIALIRMSFICYGEYLSLFAEKI